AGDRAGRIGRGPLCPWSMRAGRGRTAPGGGAVRGAARARGDRGPGPPGDPAPDGGRRRDPGGGRVDLDAVTDEFAGRGWSASLDTDKSSREEPSGTRPRSLRAVCEA